MNFGRTAHYLDSCSEFSLKWLGIVEYGEKILPTLSAKLVEEYGNGYSVKRYELKGKRAANGKEIVVTLSRQLIEEYEENLRCNTDILVLYEKV